MSEDKPLHVRVAEALGCKPADVALQGEPIWQCPCRRVSDAHDPPHAVGGYGYEFASVAHYDTDWSATGPLIEKYGLMVGLDNDDTLDPEIPLRWVAVHNYEHMAPYWGNPPNIETTGPTPLVAVCNLILALKAAGKLTVEVNH